MKLVLPLILAFLLSAMPGNADETLRSPTIQRKPLVDRVHASFDRRLDRYANYFDNFFADERADERAANTQLRLISSIIDREGRGLSFSQRIKARISLPHLESRVNLLIDTEGDDTATLADQLSDDQNANIRAEDTSLALQLVQRIKPDVNLTHRIGLSLKNEELNPKFRSQIRFLWQTSDRDLVRFTQALFWEKFAGFGQDSRLDYEHLLHKRSPEESSLFRISLRGLTSEASDGYEWVLPLEILNALPNRRAYSYGGSISGVTDSSCGITNSSLFVRYRQSFWRKWLYVDLTPQLEWPKEKNRNTTASVKLSFEVIF